MARALAVLLVLLATPALAGAAEFTADLVTSQDIRVKEGKILVRGAKYRMELPDPSGPDLVVLVDPAANVTRVLVPRYEVYMELACDEGLSRMNDPFQGAAFTEKHYEKKAAGTEKVQGHECEKLIFEYGGRPVMAKWVSKELGFALKIKMLVQEDHYTELRSVKVEPVGEELFKVPEGYALADFGAIRERMQADPEMLKKIADWKEVRPRKLELTPMLSVGDEIRVLLVEGTKARVKVEGGFEEPYVWYAVPHRAGKALAEDAACAHKGNARVEFGAEPDLVVCGVMKGKPSLKLRLVGRKPVALAISKAFRIGKGSGKGWGPGLGSAAVTVTVTAVEDVKANYSATKRFESKRETEKTELTLAAGETKTFVYEPEDHVSDFDLTVMQGKVRVKSVADRRPADQRKPF